MTKIQGYNSEALDIALRIFQEYLSFEAPYLIHLEEKIRVNLFQKFGCQRKFSQDLNATEKFDSLCYDTTEVNPDALMPHLDMKLFQEIYPSTLENLHVAFENFRKSLSFAILKIDVKRQEKLFEIMIEGDLVDNI